MIISIATGPWLPVPAIQGGAVNRRWQGLAEEFAARGHEVRMICRSYPGQPSTETINGVQYIRSGGFPQSTNIAIDLLKDFIYAASVFAKLPPADILVINDFWLPVFASLRPSSGKIVVNAARVPKGQYRLYAKAASFIAVSHPIQQAIIRQHPAVAARTRVIHNPIDTKIFCPPAQPRSNQGEKTILYVGRLHPEKGVHLLIDAFALLSKQFPKVKLRIVGPIQENQGGGGEKYLDRLKAKAQGLAIEFLPPVFDPSKLARIYQDADLFCYPSLADKGEAFGVAPLEAMACGLVPVISNLDCFKDFITDGTTGYFFEHRNSDPCKQLADVLLKAILTWETTIKTAKDAAQQAKKFSYGAVAKQYLSEFESLLAEQKGVLV